MLQVGIVGLPNVGKSTLFNALTAAGVSAENYPFCTVEPNVGIVEVPDSRLGVIQALTGSVASVPAHIQFVEIAGLVKGASEGEGLGNRFLARIREVDAIAHVLRCFDDPDVTHVLGSLDPCRDLEVVETELALADLETLMRRKEQTEKKARSGERDAAREMAVLDRALEGLSRSGSLRELPLPVEQQFRDQGPHRGAAGPVCKPDPPRALHGAPSKPAGLPAAIRTSEGRRNRARSDRSPRCSPCTPPPAASGCRPCRRGDTRSAWPFPPSPRRRCTSRPPCAAPRLPARWCRCRSDGGSPPPCG